MCCPANAYVCETMSSCPRQSANTNSLILLRTILVEQHASFLKSKWYCQAALQRHRGAARLACRRVPAIGNEASHAQSRIPTIARNLFGAALGIQRTFSITLALAQPELMPPLCDDST
jgi:predicted deacetylase